MSTPIQNVRIAKPGDEVSARQWNRIRVGLIAALGGSKLSGAQSNPQAWAHAMRHEITGILDDYLVCRRVWRDPDIGTTDVFVARPALLRASLASRDGVTYAYADSQNRTASKAGEVDEVQIVTPNYLVGDVIEVDMVSGVTGISQVDGQRGRPVDKNLDGRAWATVPPVVP